MSEKRIIEFSPDYYEKVIAFWEEIGLGGSHRGDSLDTIISTIHSDGHLLIMIDDNNDVVGSSWLTNDRRRTYIHHFGIKESCRRQGLAKRLLNQSMEVVNKMGYQVKLEVHKENLVAINLYKKFGFGNLGEYEILIKRDVALPM